MLLFERIVMTTSAPRATAIALFVTLMLSHPMDASANLPIRAPEVSACVTFAPRASNLSEEGEVILQNFIDFLESRRPGSLSVSVSTPVAQSYKELSPSLWTSEAVALTQARVTVIQTRLQSFVSTKRIQHWSFGGGAGVAQSGLCEARLTASFVGSRDYCSAPSAICLVRCTAAGCEEVNKR